MRRPQDEGHTGSPPIIPLRLAPGERASWDRSIVTVLAWYVIELLLVTNPVQTSSRVRVWALRLFGADIGPRVIFRPRTRVRFPWKLVIGQDSWIGEGVWFHNQDRITVGANVVISQDSFLTTGSHAHRRDMALITRPIEVQDGSWITTRSLILGGVTIGTSALITPLSVIDHDVPPNSITGGNPAIHRKWRFDSE